MIFLYKYFDYLVILSNPMFSTELMESSQNFTKLFFTKQDVLFYHCLCTSLLTDSKINKFDAEILNFQHFCGQLDSVDSWIILKVVRPLTYSVTIKLGFSNSHLPSN